MEALRWEHLTGRVSKQGDSTCSIRLLPGIDRISRAPVYWWGRPPGQQFIFGINGKLFASICCGWHCGHHTLALFRTWMVTTAGQTSFC